MTGQWVEGPFELLPVPGQPGAKSSINPEVQYMCWDMANVHNALLRGLNAIYLQCDHIQQPKDVADFMLYIKAWGDLVHHHHHSEESMMFPEFDRVAKEAGDHDSGMNTNIDQHHLFEPGFEKLRQYATEVHEGKKQYDGRMAKAMIDDFAPIFTQHLHDEVTTLFRLEKYDGVALKKIFDDVVKKGVKTADANFVVPLFFGCLDKKSPGNEKFPSVPFFLPWLNALWFVRKHKGVWRFNPSDSWGTRRPLQFLG